MQPLKVAIDCQAILGDIQTGLGVYARNLVESLEKFPQDIEVVKLYPAGKKPLRSTPQRLLWEQVRLPWEIARSDADIFHSPALSMPLLGSGKKIATAHDVIILKHPGMMSGLARWYFADFVPKTLQKADHVIANSVATRKDLQRYLGIPEKRITVIPLGVDKEYLGHQDTDLVNTMRRMFHLSASYIISVASFEPRKNHTGILKGFAEASKKLPPDIRLVLVGRKNDYQKKMAALADELGISERVAFCGYQQTRELAALTSGASMLLFPSHDEGFGIPILEAFAVGIPVITSDIDATREVGGNAALYVNPDRHQEIAREILNLYSDPQLREEFIEKGRNRVAKFSWESHARETIRIYYKALGRTRDLK